MQCGFEHTLAGCSVDTLTTSGLCVVLLSGLFPPQARHLERPEDHGLSISLHLFHHSAGPGKTGKKVFLYSTSQGLVINAAPLCLPFPHTKLHESQSSSALLGKGTAQAQGA